MQNIIFVYDKKLSRKNSQFTVRLSNRRKKGDIWEKYGPSRVYFVRDLPAVTGSVPDRSLFKTALESEMGLRKIEGRFFSESEEFTNLRINSRELIAFIRNAQRKKIVVHENGERCNFSFIKECLPEVKVGKTLFNLMIAGHPYTDCDFVVKAQPVTLFFQRVIVQLNRSITYTFLKDLFLAKQKNSNEFEKLLITLTEHPDKVRLIMSNENNKKVINDSMVIPVLEFDDSLKHAGLSFLYHDIRISSRDKRSIVPFPDLNTEVHRNMDKEALYRDKLLTNGFLLRSEKEFNWFLSSKGIDAVIPVLKKEGFRLNVKNRELVANLKVNWSIKTDQKKILVGGRVVSGDFMLESRTLVQAFENGRSYIKRPDGSYGLISSEINALLKQIKQAGGLHKEGISFRKSDFSYVSNLFEEFGGLETDRGYQDLSTFAIHFRGINRYQVPSNLVKTLRPYQMLGFNWLRTLFDLGLNGILADDMGLGKTLQVLTLIQSLKCEKKKSGPVLIVLPKTLIFNWELEIEKFVPDLSFYVYTGTGRVSNTDFFNKHDIILTSYGLIRNEITLFCSMTWCYLILDEAQSIKNPFSLISKAIRKIPSENRLCLTGTPVENSPTDLWSQFDFLMPGFLYGLKKFKTRYSQDSQNLSELHVKTRPYILRRLKKEVLSELPPKTEMTLFCDFSDDQKRVYDEALVAAQSEINEYGHKKNFKILTLILRLRQIACHPSLALAKSPKKQSSGKLDSVFNSAMEVLSEGHSILIFSQFTGHLKLVRDAFMQVGILSFYLDGQVKNRKKVIENFKQHSEPSVFLISLKTGGTGLNLTEASYVFLLDPWWNPSVENQAIDRCYRMGQKKPVFVYRFITKGSIEEKVSELKNIKKKMGEKVISESDVDYAPVDNTALNNLII